MLNKTELESWKITLIKVWNIVGNFVHITWDDPITGHCNYKLQLPGHIAEDQT